MNPRLFRAAVAIFFALGIAEPLVHVAAGKPANPFFQTVVYLVGAVVFWLWLYADARLRSVPGHWAVLVGIAWLAFSVVAASIYLLFTRGVRAGALAVLALFAIVLQLFAALAVGVILSVEAVNVLGIA